MKKIELRDKAMFWSWIAFGVIFVAGQILFTIFGVTEVSYNVWRIIMIPAFNGIMFTSFDGLWNWITGLCERAAEWRER